MSGSSREKNEPGKGGGLQGESKADHDTARNLVSSRTEDGWTMHLIEEPVSFLTEDGWTIHGTLTTPAALGEGSRVAAILLLHSLAHDQDYYLEYALKETLATLDRRVEGT